MNDRTEIALYGMQDLSTMANAIAKSGLFGMKTPEQAMALMLVAQSENCHPATITQDYDIIQGKACRKTHSVMARFQQMGGKVEWHNLDEHEADATFSHPAGGRLRIKWTFEQANRAGLTGKDNWKNYPRAMLRARCIAEGIRAVYPAAIGGMMVAEEAQDQSFSASGDERLVTGEVVRDESIRQAILPPYSDDQMKANADGWRAAIASGKKTPDSLIAMISTRYTLTAAQREAIRDLVASDVPGADFIPAGE